MCLRRAMYKKEHDHIESRIWLAERRALVLYKFTKNIAGKNLFILSIKVDFVQNYRIINSLYKPLLCILINVSPPPPQPPLFFHKKKKKVDEYIAIAKEKHGYNMEQVKLSFFNALYFSACKMYVILNLIQFNIFDAQAMFQVIRSIYNIIC